MKKIAGLLIMPLLVWGGATDLRTLIRHAEHNDLNQAKRYSLQSKTFEAEAAERAYAPTIDIGLSHRITSPISVQSPGAISTAFLKTSMNLFDGGRTAATKLAKQYARQAAFYELQASKKSTALGVVRAYFGLKKVRANLTALRQRARELRAQLARIRALKKAGMATAASVDKLRAAYEDNLYAIENAKLMIQSSEEQLKLLSGLSAHHLRRNYFLEPKRVRFRVFEATRALQAQAKSVGKSADAIGAAYMPQANLSYTYSHMAYDDLAPGIPPASLPDHKHTFQVNVGMRLYDGGTIGSKSEAVRCQKMALLSRARHAVKEQKMEYRLARKRLETSRAQIRSTRSALAAAMSNYAAVKKRFEAGLVDNVTYLDALSQRTMAAARYQATRYDYESNKAIYYFYAGARLERYIR